jgi:hypothetical protein
MKHTPTPTSRVENVAQVLSHLLKFDQEELVIKNIPGATFSTLDVGVGACVMQYTRSYKAA